MADNDDDLLEKVHEELLRKTKEEQERQEAETEAARLEAESRQAFEETKKRLDEMIDEYKKAFSDIQEQYKKAVEEVSRKIGAGKNSEWEKLFISMGATAGAVLGEAMSRSLRLSIDTANLGDLQTSLGGLAKKIAPVLGGAIGAIFGGVPGAIIGAAGGSALGGVFEEAGMQLEGHRMMGARIAPLAGASRAGGKLSEERLTEMGLKYREITKEIVMHTGATTEEVGRAIVAYSQLGSELFDGAEGAAEFSLGMDRILRLQPGTVLKMQTELVRQYGESIGSIRPVLGQVVAMTDEYSRVQSGANAALAQSFSSAMLVSDALGQITSQARNSGASMESLTFVARSLMDVMVTGKGAGQQRHEQIVRGAGSALSVLLPQSRGTTGEEAMPSGITRYFMEATPFGQQQIGAAIKFGTEKLGMSPEYAQANLLTTARMSLVGTDEGKATMKGKGAGVGWALGYLGGIDARLREGGAETTDKMWMLLEKQGMSKDAIAQVLPLVQTIRGEGIFQARDPLHAYSRWMREKSKDPEQENTKDRLKELQKQMRDLGEDQKSAMDKAAAALTDVSTYFGGKYWSEARNWMREAFGFQKTSEVTGDLSERQKRNLQIKAPAVAAFHRFADSYGKQLGGDPFTTGEGLPGWMVQTETIRISPSDQNALANDAARNMSGMKPTGAQ